MKVKAYAKVNLALDVVSEREDGYHELRMVMAPITLHDLIFVDVIESGIVITTNSKIMPTDKRNIIYKVAQRLMDDYNITKGVKIHVYKHIPSQAGLAGGSADGAAVMRAINELFHLNLSLEKLAEIGAQIGADIPFCIYNKTAEVKGIGEKLEFTNDHFNCHVLLVKPYKGVSTKKSFTALNMDECVHPDIDGVLEGIKENDLDKLVTSMGNSLEAPSINFVPDIEKIKKEMLAMGFDGVLMSGSGSCVFGLTRDKNVINGATKHFQNKYFFVRRTEFLHQ